MPHRLEEGYGLNCDALRQIAEAGVSLVVTVDCGIASMAEADEAKRLGLELIVTDHHEFKDTLPDAAVLVHPRLPGTSYPFGKLSGSAVAFKLAWALAQRACGSPKVTPRFREYLLDSVALAALGVVADVVPLHDENRILVRHGLNRLRQTTSPGLLALCACAGLTPGRGTARLRHRLQDRAAPQRRRPSGLRSPGGRSADDAEGGAGGAAGALPGRAEQRSGRRSNGAWCPRRARWWTSKGAATIRLWCWRIRAGTPASSASWPAGSPICMLGRR